MTKQSPIITYNRAAKVFTLWASLCDLDFLGEFDSKAAAEEYFNRWLRNEV